jgi:MoxR-like ATPase
MATQNPIESEGTYPLPEAQVDRFMLKILVGYPEHDEELTVVQRSLVARPSCAACSSSSGCATCRAGAGVYVDPGIVSYTVQLATATREPGDVRLGDLAPYISYGASPRGPISLVQSARALAFLRGRDYVVVQDVDSLAKDALRHRLVLSYQALAEQVDADRILDAVLEKVTAPELEVGRRETAA